MIVKRVLLALLVVSLAACAPRATALPTVAPSPTSTPPATNTPAPTLAPRRASLAALLEEDAIEMRIHGAGIDRVRLELRAAGEEPLEVEIPAGTLFVAGNTSVQNMIVTRGQVVKLNDLAWHSQTVEAACVNMHRDVPGEAAAFLVSASGSRNLETLLPILEQAGAEYAVLQAAIWIVTDDASYDDLGTLVSSNPLMPLGGSRLILEPEAAQAMRLIEQAGLDITRQRIWQDRERIATGVTDAGLAEWLAARNDQTYLEAVGGWTTLERASQLDTLLYSPDGSLAVTSSCLVRQVVEERLNCLEGQIQLWDPGSGAFLRSLPEMPSAARPIAIAPDSSLLAAGVCSQWSEGACLSGQVWLYDPADGTLIRILEGPWGRIYHLAFSPDGSLLAVAHCARFEERFCQSMTVNLLAMPGGSSLRAFPDLAAGGQLRFSPDGSLLAVLDWDRVRIWTVPGGQPVHTIQPGGLLVRLFEFAGRDQALYLIDQVDRLNTTVGPNYAPSVFRSWMVDLSSGQLVEGPDFGELQIDWGMAARSPQADLLALVAFTQPADSLEYARQVLLLDARNGEQIASLDAGVNVVYNLAFDSRGAFLSALTDLGMLITWPVPDAP